MNKKNIGNILTKSVALACCINFACHPPVLAQQRQWGGHSSSGGLGGPGGFSNAFALVPSVVADVLLVPSLTKTQQTRIKALYIEYRAKSAGRMDVMNKLRGPSHFRHEAEGRSNSSDKDSKPVGGEHSRDSGKSSKTSADGDSKRHRSPGGSEAGMDNASANLRRTMFMSMLKEYQKFQENIVGVLTEKQHAELKEIAKKAGSPDYFAVRHYDLMNAD